MDIDPNLTAKEQVYLWLNQIIDEVHPLFKSISDEELIFEGKDVGVYQRLFKHATGKTFLLSWKIIYGSPDTVQTIFNPAKVIDN